ncbi:PTS transporter subunit EIIC [Candidatus Symbiopectobacterium sp. 'North America']|uniref:PTS transporter subunit EIIC n=1 Tax=Candidatus Symbiopectobacterium sp. 'North America' TaxID=2794574 RepID=UPI0018C91EF1|nr:PTS transporter subunit EIIC [Candidatus Symbiopectobacterium sp. 'North America']
MDGTEVMPFRYLGAGGLFVAIMVALLVNKIYSFVVDRHLTIRMGDNVPPVVAETFNGLIPAIINVIILPPLQPCSN